MRLTQLQYLCAWIYWIYISFVCLPIELTGLSAFGYLFLRLELLWQTSMCILSVIWMKSEFALLVVDGIACGMQWWCQTKVIRPQTYCCHVLQWGHQTCGDPKDICFVFGNLSIFSFSMSCIFLVCSLHSCSLALLSCPWFQVV